MAQVLWPPGLTLAWCSALVASGLAVGLALPLLVLPLALRWWFRY